MIRLLLDTDDFVHAVETTAGEVVCKLEHICLNRDNLVGVDFVLPGEFDHAVDRGLRMDHRVVFFDRALHDALISLLVPVDVDLHSQEVINAQRALDDLERPLHSATSQEQSVHGTERGLRRSKTLPLRQRLRPNNGEGRIADRSHRDSVRDLLLAQTEQPAGGGVEREGQL